MTGKEGMNEWTKTGMTGKMDGNETIDVFLTSSNVGARFHIKSVVLYYLDESRTNIYE